MTTVALIQVMVYECGEVGPAGPIHNTRLNEKGPKTHLGWDMITQAASSLLLVEIRSTCISRREQRTCSQRFHFLLVPEGSCCVCLCKGEAEEEEAVGNWVPGTKLGLGDNRLLVVWPNFIASLKRDQAIWWDTSQAVHPTWVHSWFWAAG